MIEFSPALVFAVLALSCATTSKVVPNTVGHTSSRTSPQVISPNPASPSTIRIRSTMRWLGGTSDLSRTHACPP
ncbi:hypothetical protein [Lentzea flava]|uniref:Secreted protein n=1 Tax=Lentzea flava TaxID=103732 RepID=A0ABQ2V8L7_9PSEU|nr:hypothetical protein [Lentzea flava]MCP2204037.1 hypothetical protein [Lentzea flava]GGU73815.1 hypothetical protein GCM10010178_76570 [Lentzea flava]